MAWHTSLFVFLSFCSIVLSLFDSQVCDNEKLCDSELTTGQLISECLFDFFKFSKKPTKNLTNFCPESKKWSNHKGTAMH